MAGIHEDEMLPKVPPPFNENLSRTASPVCITLKAKPLPPQRHPSTLFRAPSLSDPSSFALPTVGFLPVLVWGLRDAKDFLT